MIEPTHKQQVAIVLWAQGFNARSIGHALSVSDKAIYKRLSKVKAGNPDAYARAKSIRQCYLKSKAGVVAARRFEVIGTRNTLPWSNNDTGLIEELNIIRKF